MFSWSWSETSTYNEWLGIYLYNIFVYIYVVHKLCLYVKLFVNESNITPWPLLNSCIAQKHHFHNINDRQKKKKKLHIKRNTVYDETWWIITIHRPVVFLFVLFVCLLFLFTKLQFTFKWIFWNLYKCICFSWILML